MGGRGGLAARFCAKAFRESKPSKLGNAKLVSVVWRSAPASGVFIDMSLLQAATMMVGVIGFGGLGFKVQHWYGQHFEVRLAQRYVCDI